MRAIAWIAASGLSLVAAPSTAQPVNPTQPMAEPSTKAATKPPPPRPIAPAAGDVGNSSGLTRAQGQAETREWLRAHPNRVAEEYAPLSTPR